MWRPIPLFLASASAVALVVAFSRAGSLQADEAQVASACAVAGTGAQSTKAFAQALIEAKQAEGLGVAKLERIGWQHVAKARETFDPGFYLLAEQTARCMQNHVPDSKEALLLLGHSLHNQHRFEDARHVAQQLVNDRGTWFDYGLLGDVLTDLGELDGAVSAYQQMIEIKPGPLAYARAATMRWLHGDTQSALDAMDMALSAGSARNAEQYAWMLAKRADYALRLGRTDDAHATLVSALDVVPEYAPALLALGRLALSAGELDSAVEYLSAAVRKNPQPEYRWALIEALWDADKPVLAREVERALHRNGARDDPRTYSLYLSSTGQQSDLAITLAERELDVRQDVFSHAALGLALHAAGQHDAAWQRMQLALTSGVDDARLHYGAGSVAVARGDDVTARALFTKASRAAAMLMPSEHRSLKRKMAMLSPQFTQVMGVSSP